MAPSPKAIAPQRQRGRDRVAAILEAAASLFAEKPYDAVTMTEVAARSGTAIGSLYRFFPTKEVLAAALLDRYGERLLGALDELVDKGPGLSPAIAAKGLLAIVQRLRRDRSVALALIDADTDRGVSRQALRNAMIERLNRIVAVFGKATTRQRELKATMLLHLIKTMFRLEHDDPRQQAALDGEAEAVIRLYLETVGRSAE